MNDDRQRESISALVDGELSEQETARLLDAIGRDPELRELWRRHHQLSALLAGQADLAEDRGALAGRVRSALEREPVPSAARRSVPPAAAGVWTAGRGLALAACVTLIAVVVVLGLTGERAPVPGPGPVAGNASVERPAPSPGPAAVAVAARGAPSAPGTTTRLTWNDTRPAVEARLNAYLLNHNEYLADGMRGMLPYARVVGYDARN